MVIRDAVDLLYDGGEGMPGIVRASKKAVAENGAKINALLLYSREDPAKELTEWDPGNHRPVVAHRDGKMVLTLSKDGKEPVRVVIAESDRRPNVYHAVSDCPAADFKAQFVSLVSRHVPTLSRIYLSSAEIRSVVEAVSSNYDVRVKFITRRSRRNSKMEFNSHMDHIDEPAEKLLSGAGNGEIRTVKLACTPRGLAKDEAAAGADMVTVARDCRFSARRGARVLFDTILPLVEDLAVKRNEQLHASAETAGNPTPEPLIVKFAKKVFADPKKNDVHIKAIASMPNIGINEHHVNPYIHLSLIDYMDCSSYDIWVLVSDRVAIIPQLSATDASMGRLVNHMMEKFGDATIEKYYEGEIGEK